MVSPIAQGPIQFRISESLNHIVVFNRKLMWGVVMGVVMFNLFFSEGGMLDVFLVADKHYLHFLSQQQLKNILKMRKTPYT